MNYPSDFKPELSKKPICGVLSCAVISGRTFAEATEAAKKNLEPWQKRHGGKTFEQQRAAMLTTLGVQYVSVPTSKQTLHRWVLNEALAGVTYQVTTSSHVVTVRDGMVLDQYEHSPIEIFKARRCFVRSVLRII